jgi:hypothetical protein
MRDYRKFTDDEKKALFAAFELKETLTDKALARKFGRTPRAIWLQRWRWREKVK